MSENKMGLKEKVVDFLKSSMKIVGLLLLFAAFGVFYAIGSRASDPKRFAEEYFSCYVTNNYKDMYKMSECKESEFINQENFINKCEGEKVYGSITGYKFNKAVEDGNKITYVVTYYLGKDKTVKTYTITLNKQKKKQFLFFNTWKVSMDRYVIKDYKINVPVGTEVKLDGVDISKYKSGTSSDGTIDYYVIDTVLSGDHTVTVKLDATGEITKTQYVSADDAVMTVATDDFAIKPDVQQKLYNSAAFIVQSMYEYAMDKERSAADIAVFYASNSDAQSNAQSVFDKISGEVNKADGASIRAMNFKKITPEIESFTYPDRVTVKLTFDYEYSAVTGTSMLNGLVTEYQGTGTDTAYVYFNQIDDDWKIVKVDMSCIDYSQKDNQ